VVRLLQTALREFFIIPTSNILRECEGFLI
jgi:hypothetical protein